MCLPCIKFAYFIHTALMGGLPLADICHTPVNRPPFKQQFVTECPFFHNFTPNDPLFLLFQSKFSSEVIKFLKTLQIATKILKKKLVKIPWIFCNFTPNDPLYQICHSMIPFFSKLSLITP